jgi:OOP family OmpA-OmpF porin
MIGPEQARLARLEERPVPTAETVGDVLPEAVARTSKRRSDALAIALEPAVTTAVRSVTRKEAEFFGEILAPAIGAAVRKAVSEAMAAMLQRFNEALERSLSIRGVKWRIEARRTDRPFAEVVLLHTLVYRVEEVFLIHAETGLVLQHVVADGTGVKDPDQVSSMLEAIDSFVREALRPQPSGVHLSSLQVGDLTVWVDRGASAAVAAVVRGVAPRDLGDRLREARERISLTHQAELARFQSDASPFLATRPALERCLFAQRRPPPKRAQIWLAAAAALAIAALGALFARGRARASELDAYVETLGSQPGILVTSAERAPHGRIRIAGLRDPLSSSPAELLARRGLTPAELRLQPFYSLDPGLVEERAQRLLGPPPNVTLAFGNGVLAATGTAPRKWIERARGLAPSLPGIERYDDGRLYDEEAVRALRAASAALAEVEVPFARGSSVIGSAAAMRRAESRMRQVTQTAGVAGLDTCVEVLGHADPTGSEERNRELGAARATRVVEELTARGESRGSLRPLGAGTWADAGSEARARSVTFRVKVGDGCAEKP